MERNVKKEAIKVIKRFQKFNELKYFKNERFGPHYFSMQTPQSLNEWNKDCYSQLKYQMINHIYRDKWSIISSIND